jgi:rRNA-processing protein FCF1
MRHGRAKQARKTLQFFQRITNNAICPPYSILLDGTFLVALIQYKLQDEMLNRLDRLLQHPTTMHLITTRSTLIELQKLEQAVTASKKNDSLEKAILFRQARVWAETHCIRILENDCIPDESTVDISAIPTTPLSVTQQQQQGGNNKQQRCGRGGGDVSLVGRDILRIVMAVLVQDEDKDTKEKSATAATAATDDSTPNKEGEEESGTTKEDSNNRHKRQNQHQRHQRHHQHCYYFVASQDEQVLDRLRHLGHVPIIRLARGSVLLLEQPSKAATQQAWREERLKWRLGIGSTVGAAGATTGNNKTNGATASASAASSMLQQERSEAQRLVNEERQERRREQQQQQQPYQARHKKRAKGPNPLSCKPGSKKKQKT